MVKSRSKRPREEDSEYPTPIATNDHASIQLNFYRILTYTVGLDFACPLCLTGYSRYDALYAHFRNTEEKQHEALKDLWFSGVCTVCKEPSDTTTFYHIKCRHPGSYQTLMKNTLRLRPEVNETIPAAPHCFEHKFFFPLRQPASIVRLPRKKRKTRKPAGKGYPSDNQESSMDGASHLLTTSGLAHQESQLLSAYEPCGYGVADGTCNLGSANLAHVSESVFTSMGTFYGEQQWNVSLNHRGCMTDLDTQWQITPYDTPYPTDDSTQLPDNDTDGGQIRRN